MPPAVAIPITIMNFFYWVAGITTDLWPLWVLIIGGMLLVEFFEAVAGSKTTKTDIEINLGNPFTEELDEDIGDVEDTDEDFFED